MIVIAIAASSRGPAAQARVDAAVVTTPPPPPITDGAGGVLEAADELVARGKREQALQLIVASRGPYPSDARLAVAAGKLLFHKMWWVDGLKQFRDAVRLDPTYKTDADLIKVVLRGFNTTPNYHPEIARFLREDIGPVAKEYLEETAKTHPSPGTRSRAAAELKRHAP